MLDDWRLLDRLCWVGNGWPCEVKSGERLPALVGLVDRGMFAEDGGSGVSMGESGLG